MVTLEESKTKPEEIKSMYNDLTKDIVPSSSEEYELKDKIKSYLESPTVPKMNEIKELVNKIRQESKKREETHIEQVESLLDMIASKPSSINVITQKRKRGRPKKVKPQDEEVKETKQASIEDMMSDINKPLIEEKLIESKVVGNNLMEVVRKFPPLEGVSLKQMKEKHALKLHESELDAYGFGVLQQNVYKLTNRNIFFIDSRKVNGLIFFRISEAGEPVAVDIKKLYSEHLGEDDRPEVSTDQPEASADGGMMLAGEMSKFSKDKAIDYFLKYASQREKFRSGDDKYRYEKGDKKAIKQLKSIYNINKSFKALSTLSRLVNEYGNDFVKKYKDALRPAVRKMFKPTK